MLFSRLFFVIEKMKMGAINIMKSTSIPVCKIEVFEGVCLKK